MLDRLLALNVERYEDEVRWGLHEKTGGKGTPARGSKAGRGAARQAPTHQGEPDF